MNRKVVAEAVEAFIEGTEGTIGGLVIEGAKSYRTLLMDYRDYTKPSYAQCIAYWSVDYPTLPLMVAGFRLEESPELLDAIVDALKDNGFNEPGNPDTPWSVFYRA